MATHEAWNSHACLPLADLPGHAGLGCAREIGAQNAVPIGGRRRRRRSQHGQRGCHWTQQQPAEEPLSIFAMAPDSLRLLSRRTTSAAAGRLRIGFGMLITVVVVVMNVSTSGFIWTVGVDATAAGKPRSGLQGGPVALGAPQSC